MLHASAASRLKHHTWEKTKFGPGGPVTRCQSSKTRNKTVLFCPKSEMRAGPINHLSPQTGSSGRWEVLIIYLPRTPSKIQSILRPLLVNKRAHRLPELAPLPPPPFPRISIHNRKGSLQPRPHILRDICTKVSGKNVGRPARLVHVDHEWLLG